MKLASGNGVTSACAECRRRRIKCDGLSVPCRQCNYYQVPHLCHFPPRKTRNSVSWRVHAGVSETLDKARKVLSIAFPSHSLDELSLMTRDELLGTVLALVSDDPVSTLEKPEEDFRMLEPSPDRDFTWDEVSNRDESQPSRIADNVNGLEFWGDSDRESYLGLPSIPTILRVISRAMPKLRQQPPPNPETCSSTSELELSLASTTTLSEVDEISLINAYFTHAHHITPMVDEVDFRTRYAQADAAKGPCSSWMALLNMVLAMGCLASDTTLFTAENIYCERAAQHLSISSLGSGNLYTVQAMGLYGGYLLHFLHKPNMANAIIGAAIRMAVAMGMHRARLRFGGSRGAGCMDEVSVITRVRTWWSLFCLDTWAAATLGRPNMGFWDPATILTSPTSLLTGTDYSNISLAASEEFCKIASRIQDRLIRSPLMTKDEILRFDEELMGWRNSLHTFLGKQDSCPPALRVARGWIWSRFMTTRLTLYRPCLLQAALRRSLASDNAGYDGNLVTKSIEVARDTVDTLTLDWFPNQLVSWNAAWHLFQAALVLVLALALDIEWARENSCHESVQKALDLFSCIEHASPGGTYSREIIRHLYRVAESNCPETANEMQTDITSTLTLDFLDPDLMGQDADWLELLYGNDYQLKH
ncbi:fungal-specific transcription factor domain-containing protein [Thelonectria olida]|uniref:Fungal-specific transcription factor domain-containing protein n=1 Tax=Thelonectria olida TaxID=1576542 RepID=A0A9P9AP59_9HYPO|nr:fungal-specific transcription factor domain-containing protein [Thelonectria olida]